MPKRISKKLANPTQSAAAVVAASTWEKPRTDGEMLSLLIAERDRKGGKIGGKKRLETMSPAERRRLASKATKARWKKRK